MITFSNDDARKLFLSAQGFEGKRTQRNSKPAELEKVMNTMKVVQLDAVPIVVRSQYLPFFSRLGKYDMSLYEQIAYKHDKWFELWAHEASIAPSINEPFFRLLKQRAKRGDTWKGLYEVATQEPEYVKKVLNEVKRRGPLEAKELSDPRYTNQSGWGSRSVGQLALNWLYRIGELGIRRGANFEKKYDIISNIVPQEILALRTPSEEESLKKLFFWAIEAMGVASERDIQDYFRVRSPNTINLLQEMEEEGVTSEVKVEGWGRIAYTAKDVDAPKRISSSCLLSPFDPIIWNRERLKRIFNFDYKLEIYKPASKRQFGYYVLPFMHHGQIVGRVDLANRRTVSELEVLAAYCEPSYDKVLVAEAMWQELTLLAAFVGCSTVKVNRRGNLSQQLSREGKGA